MFILIFMPLNAFSAEFDQDLKKSIDVYKAQAQTVVPDQKGALNFKLAIAYLQDQDQEKAFQSFVEALELTRSRAAPQASAEESQLYEQGLAIYLDHTGTSSPKETALKIYQNYKQAAEGHPDFYLLNLLMATAYANLGRFEEFFNAFYRSYPYYTEHYLTYKTKAVLHIKLYERARVLEDRDAQKKLVVANIEKAIDKNPQDTGLYKIAFLFSDNDKKSRVVAAYLNKIIDEGLIVPRNDVPIFVHEAIEERHMDLAQKFVDKSREWYQYSRAVNEAQELINKAKKTDE